MHNPARSSLIAILIAATIATGCSTSAVRREIDRYQRRRNPIEQPSPEQPAPEQPTPNPAPQPQPQPDPAPAPAPQPQPPPPAIESQSLLQWIPDRGDGRAILRIRAWLGPRGYSIITARHHKSIDPPIGSHTEWMDANNYRPPDRFIDGWAEWTMPFSGAEFARRAEAFATGSGFVVMVFNTTQVRPAPDKPLNVSHFINPRIPYGHPGGRLPTLNIDNTNWQPELK